jgi:hypothetical protein
VLWALIPLLSFGLLAPVPFAVAAVRLQRRRMWAVAAAYAAGSLLVIAGVSLSEGSWGGALVLVAPVLMVAGTTHALVLRRRVFAPAPTGVATKTRWPLLLGSVGVLVLGVVLVVGGVHEVVDNLRPPRRRAGAPTGWWSASGR